MTHPTEPRVEVRNLYGLLCGLSNSEFVELAGSEEGETFRNATIAELGALQEARTTAEAASRQREDALREALKGLENAACMVRQWRSTIMCRFDGKLDWGQWSSLNDSFDHLEEKSANARAALSPTATEGEGDHD